MRHINSYERGSKIGGRPFFRQVLKQIPDVPQNMVVVLAEMLGHLERGGHGFVMFKNKFNGLHSLQVLSGHVFSPVVLPFSKR
jgi:hypothetical protein